MSGGVDRDGAVAAWFAAADPLRAMLKPWFDRARAAGPDVRELFHDHCPVVLVADAPFAYFNAFTAHAAVGFHRGAFLPDPARLLEGAGKRMRHIKLKPGVPVDEAALGALIDAAYTDIKARLEH